MDWMSAVVGFAVIANGFQDAPVRQSEPGEGPADGGPHPELVRACDELAVHQQRLFESHAESSPDEDAVQVWVKETIHGWSEEGRRELAGFEFSIEELAEVHLAAHAAVLFQEAFERSRRYRRPIHPDDLLALFDPRFLTRVPDPERFPASTELARVMSERIGVNPDEFVDTRLEIGPRNAGRIAFAALHDPGFWDSWKPQEPVTEHANPRADLIHAMIRQVDESGEPATLSMPVLRALAFPMQWPLTMARGSRVVPAPEEGEEIRASVGFLERDLAYLRGLLTGIERQRLQSSERASDQDAPLVDFVTELRRRVEWELRPDSREDGAFRMFRGSLRQQKADWEWYVEQFGVVAFWEQARIEIHSMLRGDSSHPLDEEIRELRLALQELAPAAANRQDLELTLRRLERRRQDDQDHLTSHLMELLATSATSEMTWAELDAMDRAVAQVRGSAKDVSPTAWLIATDRDPGFALRRLEAHLRDRDPARITDDAREAALYEANRSGRAETRELLLRTGLHGEISDRSAAMRYSTSLAPDDARTVFDTALDDVLRSIEGAGDGVTSDRRSHQRLLSSAAVMIVQRAGDGEWTGFRQSLRDIFQKDGVALWAGRVGPVDEVPWLKQLINLVPEADYQELVQRGAMPPAFQKARGERR